jgi:hypothetical protein
MYASMLIDKPGPIAQALGIDPSAPPPTLEQAVTILVVVSGVCLVVLLLVVAIAIIARGE